jgi:hypothetical protein
MSRTFRDALLAMAYVLGALAVFGAAYLYLSGVR